MLSTEEICARFGVKGEFAGETTLTSGNINRTVRVGFKSGGVEKRYILQRINTYVFKNAKLLMNNVALLQDWFDREDRGIRIPRYYKSGGNAWFEDESGFYRLCDFEEGTVAYDIPKNLGILRSAGKGFGLFQKATADFPAGKLAETIPGFHDMVKRIKTLEASAEKDVCGRLSSCREELEYILSRREYAKVPEGMPLRVTHNDTKCNNILFDEKTDEPVCVIDLDTVMPGYVAHDFGDGIRFAANTAAEDDPDVSKVSLDLDRYKAFYEGFAGEIEGIATDPEMKSLPWGAYVMTLELCARFLTDYLDGDVYFKCGYEEHNIVRTRNQIALARDIEKKLF